MSMCVYITYNNKNKTTFINFYRGGAKEKKIVPNLKEKRLIHRFMGFFKGLIIFILDSGAV